MRLLPLLFSVSFFACGQEIGDACNSSAECGTGRLCDRASKDGYCTVTPCTVAPNSCPENSFCVEFSNEQTFCMAACEENDDCREGYTCVKHEFDPDDDPETPNAVAISDHSYCQER